MPTNAGSGERHARLMVRPGQNSVHDSQPHFVSFRAANGERLGNSEQHPTFHGAMQARGDWIDAMVDVLRQEGYTVTTPGDEDSGPHNS